MLDMQTIINIMQSKMAVKPSKLSCSNSMHLSDNEKKKKHDDLGKGSAIQ